MAAANGPYLVIRRDDGYGDVFPLQPGQRLTLGRANTNRIVLKDELCSREHAEVYYAENRWRLRDLKSLNGTMINGSPLTGDWELAPGSEFQVGRTRFVFVDNLEELPDLPVPEQPEEGMSIKKRLGQTRYMTPVPDDAPKTGESTLAGQRSLSRDLSLLYRLALDMGSAAGEEELARTVLDGLLEAVPAEVGAILHLKEGRELEVTAHRHRDPSIKTYTRVSEFVTHEVMAGREAILAEDVSRDRYLRDRESLTHLGATSLICAPVIFGNKILGLIHLYCTDPHRALGGEDLEFTVAVAKQLGTVMHQMKRQESLSNENQELRNQLKVESELVGSARSIKHIEEQIARVAPTHATVLIRGESGSGKELVARAIHYSSPRRQGPFVCLNCAAITETLLESELFGHEKGAFTGATEKKIGKFEASDQGTIFLDEIGEMAINTQAKLLRVLEGHSFERVGGGTQIKVDVRVVAATNQPLEKNLQDGKFRRDLFYRLQVVEIRVPPLRERLEDVPILAEHFLKKFIAETGRKIRGLTPAAVQKMQTYHWPGNVRELRNVIERAVALGRGPMLDVPDIWLSSLEVPGLAVPLVAQAVYEPVSLEEIEKRHILKTLDHTDWNKSQAATILQIERSTLDRKIKGYGLRREE
ncbi:MAG: sigma 54-interacting transcriptional regulator [Planctomycetes bacterium]|nr:sigma 54-interacting transcriptional regulator [Planctomycetota bacterium]